MNEPILYKTNTGARVTAAQCWFWPVDTHNNVVVDPATIRWTKDTWAEFKRVTQRSVAKRRVAELLDIAYEYKTSFASFAYVLASHEHPWVPRHVFDAWMRHCAREKRHG